MKMKQIKKVVFVEPESPDVHVFSRMMLPRLGTVLLGTVLKRHGYEVKSYVESIEALDIQDVLSADAVGISTITSTAPRAYEIARLVKETGIPVFMGGVHVTYLPNEALEHCDFVLRGEADDCILDFIRALEKGEGFEAIPGLSFRKNGAIVHNTQTSFCKNMDVLPCPDFSIIGGLEEKPYTKLNITPIMTSRGCPYDCSFCSVTGMFGHKYRFRSKERVLEELVLHREGGGNWVFFYDDNFAAHKRRTKELLKAMIEQGFTPPWTAQVRVEIAKDQELLDLMVKSGCHTVYIGLESINPATLKAYNKKQSVEDIERCIKTLHEKNISIHGMYVLGSDEDTSDTIGETAQFAKKNDIESVQFLILTPLPGTKCFRDFEKEGRILTKDWSLYDAHHVVFQPKQMTVHELQQGMVKATKEFYSLWQVAKRIARGDFFNVALKMYGRAVIRAWARNNAGFLRKIKQAGVNIELAAKQTAEDLKEKFRAHLHKTPGK